MTVKSYLKYTIFFVFGMWFCENKRKWTEKIYFPISILAWLYLAIYSADKIVTTVFVFRYLKNIIVLMSCFVIIANFFDFARRQHTLCEKGGKFLGKNSMVFYLFHQPFCAMFGLVLYEKIGLPGYITCMACLGGSLVLPGIIILISRRSEIVQSALILLFDIKLQS